MTGPLPTVAVAAGLPAVAAAPATPPTPLPAEARDPVLDALRGAALLPVLAVNLVAMGHPQATGLGAATAEVPGGWALDLIALLFTGKGYALLALIFGHGVGTQAMRITAAGGDPRRFLIRRDHALGALGLLHGLLGWYGDVLLAYAVFGFCLLPFLEARPRTLLWWAGGLLAGAAACSLVLGALLHLAVGMPRGAAALAQLDEGIRAYAEADTAEALRAYGAGPWSALLVRRLADAAAAWASALAVLPEVLALFLVGLWAARTGLVTDPAARPRLIRVAATSLVVGVPADLAYARLSGGGIAGGPGCALLALAAYTLAGPALAGGLATMALLLRQAVPVRRLVRLLAPLGRVSLSAYLLQTVVFTNVFYFHGLGLYGRLALPALLALAPVAWLAEVLLAHLWLARFRLGPAERLLRRLTYGGRQPG